MKIVSGLIYHESNTFNPFPTGREQFVILTGEESLAKVASTEVLRGHGAEVIPSVYAMALSSGIVQRPFYEEMKDALLQTIARNPDLDGVWLHLHGAMVVEEIGCAEVDILRSIRELIGDQIPIAVTLDPHGNITPELAELATIVRAYRTIPHVDQPDIERRTAQLLVDQIGKTSGRIGHAVVPMALSGEMALSAEQPLSDIIDELDRIEQIPGILDASYFVGFAWADVPWNSGAVIVVPEDARYSALAQELADRVSKLVIDRAPDFKFNMPLLPIPDAIKFARTSDHRPVVIADSGDNTTGGAVGTSTVMLRAFLEAGFDKRVCITTILDPVAMKELSAVPVGSQVSVKVGYGELDYSEPVTVSGTLTHKGELLGYMSSKTDVVGSTVTVRAGNIDVILTDISGSFVTVNHFARAGVQLEDYDVIVLKQGYMFPDIARIAGDYTMALTPGATYQRIDQLSYQSTEIPSIEWK